MTMKTDRPVALVTAASRGMGAASARELASRGYQLVLMARSADVDALAAEVSGIGVRGTVTSDDDLRRAVEIATSRFGRLDAVVNNTGHAARGDLLAITDREWMEGLELLMLNVVRMARHATPVMLEQRGGAFVNISSTAAVEPTPGFPISATIRPSLGVYAKLFSQQYRSARTANEQRAARMGGHLSGGRRGEGDHSGAPARAGGRDREGGRIPVVVRGELHHRAEHHRGRRAGAWNLTAGPGLIAATIRPVPAPSTR